MQWQSMDCSHWSETAPADQQRLLTSAAGLAIFVRSSEREELERATRQPFGIKGDVTRGDAFLDTAVQSAGWLDVRIGQMMPDPLAWTMAVHWGLGGFAVFDAATVMDIVRTGMQRLIWAVGCALVCFVVFKVAGGEDSPLWAVATCLVYLGVTGVAMRLDQRYSQGPSGPPPPETYA